VPLPEDTKQGAGATLPIWMVPFCSASLWVLCAESDTSDWWYAQESLSNGLVAWLFGVHDLKGCFRASNLDQYRVGNHGRTPAKRQRGIKYYVPGISYLACSNGPEKAAGDRLD